MSNLKTTTAPTPSKIQGDIEQCMSNTWNTVYNQELLGRNTESDRELLKKLYLAYSLNIWEDIGDDYDKLYAQIPKCLNCNS